MGRSLGLLEVAGLLPAITVADAMAKTANIRLIAVEPARGNGWITVKIEGSVDAVSAAIDGGVAIAEGMNTMVSKKVIARPDEAVLQLFGLKQEMNTMETGVGQKVATQVKPLEGEAIQDLQVVKEAVEAMLEPQERIVLARTEAEETEKIINVQKQDETEAEVATCNLCLDPVCSRAKGELRTDCIHHEE